MSTTEAYKLAQNAVANLKTAIHMILSTAPREGMSNAEIGRVMGRSEGAIKSLYHRTLVALKDLLAEHQNIVQKSAKNDDK